MPKAISPQEVVSVMNIGGSRVSVVYGRPYSKDPKSGEMRKIWGVLVPPNIPWRTGANLATHLLTQKALRFGDKVIPAGAVTLYTLLAEDGSAQLLVNRRVGQGGSEPYDVQQEICRIPLRRAELSPRLDQFQIAVERVEGGGRLRLMWENTQYWAPFTVE